MNRFKKIIAVVLSIIMSLMMLAGTVLAEDVETPSETEKLQEQPVPEKAEEKQPASEKKELVSEPQTVSSEKAEEPSAEPEKDIEPAPEKAEDPKPEIEEKEAPETEPVEEEKAEDEQQLPENQEVEVPAEEQGEDALEPEIKAAPKQDDGEDETKQLIRVKDLELVCENMRVDAGESATVELVLIVKNENHAELKNFIIEILFKDASEGETFRKTIKHAVVRHGNVVVGRAKLSVMVDFIPFDADSDTATAIVRLRKCDEKKTLIKQAELVFSKNEITETVSDDPVENNIFEEVEEIFDPEIEFEEIEEPDELTEQMIIEEFNGELIENDDEEEETAGETASEPETDEEELPEEVKEEQGEEPAEVTEEEVAEEDAEVELTDAEAELSDEIVEEDALTGEEALIEEFPEEIVNEVLPSKERPEVVLSITTDKDPAGLMDGDSLTLFAHVDGLDEGTFTIQWQKLTAAGWEDIDGASDSNLTVSLDSASGDVSYRFVVNVPEDVVEDSEPDQTFDKVEVEEKAENISESPVEAESAEK